MHFSKKASILKTFSEQFKKIDTYWNQAWSILRWKGKEVA